VCGAQPDTLAEMRNRFGVLPFYEATEDTIYEALAELADPATRAEFGERGRAHVERFHSQQAVVELMEPIYQSVLEGFTGPVRLDLSAGMVRSTSGHRAARRRPRRATPPTP
jgi:hypothetical protein